ncbi:hypothetical protein BDR04DRAFT_1121364 [Suillus decipiens]|nr:hypothetical protein BDR04DRAFT_1121364 [Suillus decipiens]
MYMTSRLNVVVHSNSSDFRRGIMSKKVHEPLSQSKQKMLDSNQDTLHAGSDTAPEVLPQKCRRLGRAVEGMGHSVQSLEVLLKVVEAIEKQAAVLHQNYMNLKASSSNASRREGHFLGIATNMQITCMNFIKAINNMDKEIHHHEWAELVESDETLW